MFFFCDEEQIKNNILRSKEKQKVYFFDYDGTLSPFVKERHKAFMYKELIPFLNKLIRKNQGKVFIITGRSIDSILPLLDDIYPIPEIWGSHGNERYIDGKLERLTTSNEDVLKKLYSFIMEKGLENHCERKVISVTLHKRGLTKSDIQYIDSVKDIIKRRFPEIDVNNFDGGYEFLIDNKNKGDAVREILDSFKEDVFPVYFGDDLTDEDAFKEIRDKGLGVLVRKDKRETNAHVWVTPPHGIVEMFKEVLCPKEDL
ncbi:MAG: trehalose-phosphatase [Candidatus Muiribacterium halophilum]|uniref:Trehalose 6-phosphate phosphatase n=1 Tax=Muiribacterium halophilum TaxID=2053465 RepID=A0A2N5ZDL8_MUIH1|nr:MAG: trehalose-phosphatase [Candidatus Muirbacterium halophilum]